MLIVTTDRLSAFDVVMNQPIPSKGEVLTKMANFWFNKIDKIVPSHLTYEDPHSFVSKEDFNKVSGRSIVVNKLKPLPIEAIIRGYIIGSGWKDYQKIIQFVVLNYLKFRISRPTCRAYFYSIK